MRVRELEFSIRPGLGHVRDVPTVKQNPACLHMLLDWQLTAQVVASNPLQHAGAGPATPLSKAQPQ